MKNFQKHGDILRNILKQKDILAKQLAEMLDKHPNTISTYLKKTTFSDRQIDELCKALDVSPTAFPKKKYESNAFAGQDKDELILTLKEKEIILAVKLARLAELYSSDHQNDQKTRQEVENTLKWLAKNYPDLSERLGIEI